MLSGLVGWDCKHDVCGTNPLAVTKGWHSGGLLLDIDLCMNWCLRFPFPCIIFYLFTFVFRFFFVFLVTAVENFIRTEIIKKQTKRKVGDLFSFPEPTLGTSGLRGSGFYAAGALVSLVV